MAGKKTPNRNTNTRVNGAISNNPDAGGATDAGRRRTRRSVQSLATKGDNNDSNGIILEVGANNANDAAAEKYSRLRIADLQAKLSASGIGFKPKDTKTILVQLAVKHNLAIEDKDKENATPVVAAAPADAQLSTIFDNLSRHSQDYSIESSDSDFESSNSDVSAPSVPNSNMATKTAIVPPEMKAASELQEAENELKQLMLAVQSRRAVDLALKGEGPLSNAATAGQMFLDLARMKSKELRLCLENDAPLLGKFVTDGATTDFLDGSEFTRLRNMRSEANKNTIDAILRDLERKQLNHKTNLKLVSIAESSGLQFQTIKERYILSHLLGVGSYGQVWFAFDCQVQEHVAVKIHSQSPASESESKLDTCIKRAAFFRRVSREIKFQAQAQHERVVSLLYCFMLEDQLSIATVLEYCPNKSLQAYLDQHSPLDQPHAKELLIQILTGVKKMNDTGKFAHHDLKPANMFFDSNWMLKIADFGLSRGEGELAEEEGVRLGTDLYLPPELSTVERRSTMRTVSNNVDVYAIGIIYIEMRLGFKYALKFSEREYYFFVGGDTRRIVVKLPNDIFKLDNVEYDFIQKCLTYDYQDRPCISDICEHEYVKEFLQ